MYKSSYGSSFINLSYFYTATNIKGWLRHIPIAYIVKGSIWHPDLTSWHQTSAVAMVVNITNADPAFFFFFFKAGR